MDSTWLTAGASTFDVTGFQFEAGSVATDFEHRSFGQELALCQRYYYAAFPLGSNTTAIGVIAAYTTSQSFSVIQFPTTMRTAPSGDIAMGSGYIQMYTTEDTSGRLCGSLTVAELSPQSSRLYYHGFSSYFSSAIGGHGYAMVNSDNFKLCFTADL